MTIDIPEILARPLRETVAGLANEATREALYGALRARREDVEPVVNAFEARREQSPRTAKGSLNGLPVTIKDQIAAGGWPRTFGLERPSRRADRASATIVARLVGLGAEVTGKTALPPNALDFQTFNRRRGRTNNPHDPRFTAGGSSGGGAAAVASGMSLLDIGADLAGSLRLPAAWCGVSSLTPTEGAWPADGMLPGGQRLQHFARIGPIARRVDDLVLLWDCLAGAEAGKETSGSYRIGLWTPDGPAPMEAAARTVWDGFSTRLAATGVNVETDPMRPLFKPESYRLFGEIMGYETGALIPAPIRWLLRRDRSPARRSPGFLAHVHTGYRRDGARHADNLARMAVARRPRPELGQGRGARLRTALRHRRRSALLFRRTDPLHRSGYLAGVACGHTADRARCERNSARRPGCRQAGQGAGAARSLRHDRDAPPGLFGHGTMRENFPMDHAGVLRARA